MIFFLIENQFERKILKYCEKRFFESIEPLFCFNLLRTNVTEFIFVHYDD